ncbi:MAG: hypothetical protein AMXMBFR84_26200 [Candidatus Hydrogenedentota bacterium]
MSQYAKDTNVPIERSKAEIERLLMQNGAESIYTGMEKARASIAFRLKGYNIIFRIAMPDPNSTRFTHSHNGARRRSNEAAYKEWEQGCRERWRCLFLCIKAKIHAIDSRVETFEQAFMPHIMMPNGQTVAEMALPAIKQSYESNGEPPLQLGLY